MIKKIGLIGIASMVTLLTACQSVNSDLGQINGSVSKLTGQNVSTTSNVPLPADQKQIKNTWNVSNSEAMAFLTQNDLTWDDGGKLNGVNWYDFWSEQVRSKTDLANKAYQYCHQDSWGTTKPGANCETYFQAYSMTNSEDSQRLGEQMEESA